LSFYEGIGIGVLKIEESESEVLKIEESESEVLKIEESESELLCTDSTALAFLPRTLEFPLSILALETRYYEQDVPWFSSVHRHILRKHLQ
jgi:hypothetical protein